MQIIFYTELQTNTRKYSPGEIYNVAEAEFELIKQFADRRKMQESGLDVSDIPEE